MIKNEFQLGVTRSQIQQLRDSIGFIKNFEGDGELAKPTKEELELDIGSIESVIWELEQQIGEYLKIKNGEKTPAFPQTIAEIGDFVIQLRIAANLTQAELAKLVNTKTQVIQRYEATDYASVSIERLNKIVRAINYYQDSRKSGLDSDKAVKAS